MGCYSTINYSCKSDRVRTVGASCFNCWMKRVSMDLWDWPVTSKYAFNSSFDTTVQLLWLYCRYSSRSRFYVQEKKRFSWEASGIICKHMSLNFSMWRALLYFPRSEENIRQPHYFVFQDLRRSNRHNSKEVVNDNIMLLTISNDIALFHRPFSFSLFKHFYFL